MKKLFLRAEFGPLWEPWEVDETPRNAILRVNENYNAHTKDIDSKNESALLPKKQKYNSWDTPRGN